jgi:hypothetical protein
MFKRPPRLYSDSRTISEALLILQSPRSSFTWNSSCSAYHLRSASVPPTCDPRHDLTCLPTVRILACFIEGINHFLQDFRPFRHSILHQQVMCVHWCSTSTISVTFISSYNLLAPSLAPHLLSGSGPCASIQTTDQEGICQCTPAFCHQPVCVHPYRASEPPDRLS